MSSVLPPELIAAILDHIQDSRSDCLGGSLVCRSWLPFARRGCRITVFPHKSSQFTEFCKSPNNTLVPTVGALSLYGYRHALEYEPLIRLFGNFTSLRSLTLRCRIPSELPHLPTLYELILDYATFPSYSLFVDFMSHLPVLQTFATNQVFYETGPADGQASFPTRSIELCSLQFVEYPLDERSIFALRPRNLTLSLPRSPIPAFLSQYLLQLGPDLQSLEILYFHSQPDFTPLLNLHANPNLHHLKLCHAFRIDYHSGTVACPALPSLLHLVSQSPYLRVLTLETHTTHKIPLSGPSWTPLVLLPQRVRTQVSLHGPMYATAHRQPPED
ncbi:hypothetical protein FB45DRAFT_76309 [Roridomyces roridus]|uniref:F-box domain-containing protein n=1 Tax=Roridomyces roridus TaxID=1738132 RepID=A0AAD7BP56_9AGAR|nr:hypothetical protein FB45DRAFT_76309 [Roridomyces roridus]